MSQNDIVTGLWIEATFRGVKCSQLGKKVDVVKFIGYDKVETKCCVRQIITIMCVTYVQENF